MEKIIKGQSWNAWTDGKDYMASIWRGDGEVHAVGFWWIDRQTFDKLPQMNFPDDVKAITAGKCIYTHANIRSVGVSVRIFDKDWKKLTAWEDLPDEVIRYGEYGDYVLDYPRGVEYFCGKTKPLAAPEGEMGRNIHLP